ncbi:MAG TPA: ribokinase, partial [Bryobacteraceae bacterium]|nr:ribokinase [Bryobacteraceae bacterium]
MIKEPDIGYSRAGGTVYVVGSTNIDLVFPIERIPRRGETIAGGDVSVVPGGKGANQACAAARSGAPTRLVSQVGTDPFATILRASLQEAGVDVSGVGHADGSTGCAWIGVYPDGENSIIVSAGANATLTPEVALDRLGSLSMRDVVMLQLETPLDTVAAVLKFARSCGAMTILDPAPAQLLPADVLGAVDLLTPNQREAAVLIGSADEEIESHAQAGP